MASNFMDRDHGARQKDMGHHGRDKTGNSAQNFLQAAVPPSHRGLFTKKAKAAGKSVQEYARIKQHAKGKLGKQARFALTAKKISRGA